jgi:hypothetical protein
MDELCGDCVDGRSSSECGEGNMTLNQYTVLGEVHIAYDTCEFFFTCTLAGIRNTVLNLELALAPEMYGFN